jgi:hypothetical protein
MFHLTKEEEKFLHRLNTPDKIQNYLDSIPFNFETEGETCMSPRRVMREKKAHCIEGAMVAAVALFLSGHKMLILNLKVEQGDYDHVVTLFNKNGYWGAISKTNHAVLRYRDPVYATVRELAMSYFNEYFLLGDGRKTMKGFSDVINLRKFGTRWITQEGDLWNIAESIFDSKHTEVVPKVNANYIRSASEIEKESASISEWEGK